MYRNPVNNVQRFPVIATVPHEQGIISPDSNNTTATTGSTALCIDLDSCHPALQKILDTSRRNLFYIIRLHGRYSTHYFPLFPLPVSHHGYLVNTCQILFQRDSKRIRGKLEFQLFRLKPDETQYQRTFRDRQPENKNPFIIRCRTDIRVLQPHRYARYRLLLLVYHSTDQHVLFLNRIPRDNRIFRVKNNHVIHDGIRQIRTLQHVQQHILQSHILHVDRNIPDAFDILVINVIKEPVIRLQFQRLNHFFQSRPVQFKTDRLILRIEACRYIHRHHEQKNCQ